MELEFKITEQDFLDYQLFSASQSARIQKRERNGHIGLTVGFLLTALYFFFVSDDLTMAIYFGICGLLNFFFYPKYFKWIYKKYYKKYGREVYSKRFDKIVHIDFKDETIISKDFTGEGKYFIKEFENTSETSQHFFIKHSAGVSLIIPKRELKDINEVRSRITALGISINDYKDWKW